MTCAFGTSRGSADSTPSTSVQMMISDASQQRAENGAGKIAAVAAQRGLLALGGGRDESRHDQPAGKTRRHQASRLRFAHRPLHRGTQGPPFNDDDFAGIDPQHLALDAAALAQKRREQPRGPDLAIAGDHIAHRIRSTSGSAARSAACRRYPDNRARTAPCSFRTRGFDSNSAARSRCRAFKRSDGRRRIARRAAPPALTSSSSAVRHAAASGQHDGFARIRGCLDDLGDPPKARGVGDARTAKFMYYPLIHSAHAP